VYYEPSAYLNLQWASSFFSLRCNYCFDLICRPILLVVIYHVCLVNKGSRRTADRVEWSIIAYIITFIKYVQFHDLQLHLGESNFALSVGQRMTIKAHPRWPMRKRYRLHCSRLIARDKRTRQRYQHVTVICCQFCQLLSSKASVVRRRLVEGTTRDYGRRAWWLMCEGGCYN